MLKVLLIAAMFFSVASIAAVASFQPPAINDDLPSIAMSPDLNPASR